MEVRKKTKGKSKKYPSDLKPVLKKTWDARIKELDKDVSEIIFLTSYPPRECGIATYSKDLLEALSKKYGKSFKLTVCPLESAHETHNYSKGTGQTLNIDRPLDYITLSYEINSNPNVALVVIQHEFGLFANNETTLLEFLEFLAHPVAITYHTVLPDPGSALKNTVRRMSSLCDKIIVMTRNSAELLTEGYDVPAHKIEVISHGTHLVPYADKKFLKEKYNLTGKKVLSTFGLLGPGKSMETTLDALPEISKRIPEVVFLIIGITHPTLVKREGEIYRGFLQQKIEVLGLSDRVRFINKFVPLVELLEYLQLTDIYLFTSRDPNQAVSGTFAYAMSCGCPVISTPIPHACEALQNEAGVLFDFEDSEQLSQKVIALLENDAMRQNMGLNGIHTSAASAWENAAIAHAKIFQELSQGSLELKFRKPMVKLDHLKKMTTEVGIIQFSKINNPDIESGYTLDDNARAMIAICQHYRLTGDATDLKYLKIYFNFIFCCFRPDGKFLNYVNENYEFTDQNNEVNLEDACGRALWSLGYLLSMSSLLPSDYKCIEDKAIFIFEESLEGLEETKSPRAMAFMIKGLFYYSQNRHCKGVDTSIIKLADRLTNMFKHETNDEWHWFECSLTYGNSVLSEAVLMAYILTGNEDYGKVAKSSFDFLISQIFVNNSVRVISNQTWLHKKETLNTSFRGGEQPIELAYTVLALSLFHKIFPGEGYDKKMRQAFDWFLGDNHLNQIIYNPCTGGSYDGLEKHTVNLNQGAESTISYLLARMAFEDL